MHVGILSEVNLPSTSDYASRLPLIQEWLICIYDDSVILHTVLTSCLGISSQAGHMVLLRYIKAWLQ